MSIHTTSANGMGGSTLAGSTITNTGMQVQDHMHLSQDILSMEGIAGVLTSLQVVQNGTPNMSINVSPGVGFILNVNFADNSITQNKYFHFINDANFNVVINANAAGNPRITSIFAKFLAGTTPDSTASNVTTFVAIDGTAAASPTAPSAPADGNSYLRIADITVANGASSITNANITDRRIRVAPDVYDGWVPLQTLSPAYQAVSGILGTIRFSSVDVSHRFGRGDKIRLKQGGAFKYFSVISSTFSTHTDIVVTGGTDHTLANAAITDFYLSKGDAPVGFPQDFNYTLTVGGSGSMTINTQVTQQAKFYVTRAQIFVTVSATWTTAGSGSTDITFTIPITSFTLTSNTALSSNALDTGIFGNGNAFIGSAATTCTLRKYDASNWGIGAGKQGTINGGYRY